MTIFINIEKKQKARGGMNVATKLEHCRDNTKLKALNFVTTFQSFVTTYYEHKAHKVYCDIGKFVATKYKENGSRTLSRNFKVYRDKR